MCHVIMQSVKLSAARQGSMRTRGHNKLDMQLQNDKDLRQYVEKFQDERNID
uniref:Uncharacterized protein n=1 Tax=Solanum lycopersicum TaxID=4081 RepID=A0A3Q7J8M6_SOLLC